MHAHTIDELDERVPAASAGRKGHGAAFTVSETGWTTRGRRGALRRRGRAGRDAHERRAGARFP